MLISSWMNYAIIFFFFLGKYIPHFRDVFNMYANMRHGITMKTLCMRFNFVELKIDERNLVQFGIFEGIIRRIYKVV